MLPIKVNNIIVNNISSDLWLPCFIGIVVVVCIVSIWWLWCFFRVYQLEKKINQWSNPIDSMDLDLTHSQGKIDANIHNTPLDTVSRISKFRNILGVIGDLTAFTAQKNPIVLEEIIENYPVNTNDFIKTPIKDVAIKDKVIKDTPITTDVIPSNIYIDTPNQVAGQSQLNTTGILDNTIEKNIPVASNVLLQGVDNINQPIIHATEPVRTLVPAKPLDIPPLLFAHDIFHYQAKLTWHTLKDKEYGLSIINELNWQHTLPVCICADLNTDTKNSANFSIILAWQVIHRYELGSVHTLNIFKEWCISIAKKSQAQYDFITVMDWENFIDEAHSLLSGLDGAIILKISVPLTQLDLFAQSLLAARFVQQQEHWIYSDIEQKNTVLLERLWQTLPLNAVSQPLMEYAIFQMVLDLPHFDTLEARKIYMRIRAVVKNSKSSLQSVNGLHLSEGMLDKYSREMILKQEALSKAGLIPGSQLAHSIFSPKLNNHQDLFPNIAK